MMSFFSSGMGYIIPFIIVLTIVVFIHELGHYLVARYNGVKVEVFSIGIGPELFGWNDRMGTRWKVSIVPLGGYIKMYGDADESSRPDHDTLRAMDEDQHNQTLQGKTVLQRIAIVAAGPAANYLLAITIMIGLFAANGQPVMQATIVELIEGSIAQQSGFKVRDKIVRINETPITDFQQLVKTLPQISGKDAKFTVQRKNESTAAVEEITLQASMIKIDPKTGEKMATHQLGFRPGDLDYVHHSFFSSISTAFSMAWKISGDLLNSLGQIITGKKSSGELGGILSIGDMAGQSMSNGFSSLLWFIAMLSINLGLINLLPVPILDGGHILFYTIEGLWGKPVPEKAQEYAFFVGLFLVGGLMLISTWNDLMRYKIFSWIPFFN